MADQQVIATLQTQIDDILAKKNGTTVCRESSGPESTRATSHERQCTGKATPSDDGHLHDSGAAFKKIIALVNASDKSERTIRDRLNYDGFDQNAIEDAVSQAKDFGFIDDARYAEVLIRSRISQLRGSAGIIRELAQNGIEADAVLGWPYDFPVSHDEEIDRALSLLDHKPPHSKNVREAAYRRLMQKGYPSSVSSSAARIWAERK